MKRLKTIGILAGIFLGFGAPLGAALFKSILLGRMDPQWIVHEISSQAYYYAYMALMTPLVFGLFGAYFGSLGDTSRSQKKSLENLMTVLETQSMMDDVTGLYNHRHLRE